MNTCTFQLFFFCFRFASIPRIVFKYRIWNTRQINLKRNWYCVMELHYWVCRNTLEGCNSYSKNVCFKARWEHKLIFVWTQHALHVCMLVIYRNGILVTTLLHPKLQRCTHQYSCSCGFLFMHSMQATMKITNTSYGVYMGQFIMNYTDNWNRKAALP